MKNLILISGDIIENANKYNVEAIVNPANEYMEYGGGVCGVIYDKAGAEQLETYCNNKWKDNMKVNEVRITPGFVLCKEIIHIHPPRAYEEEKPIEKLKDSYIELLKRIKQEKYKSVIIPSLGTGHYGYSHQEVGEIVIRLLTYFCNNNDIIIVFNLFDEETKSIYQEYCKN